MSAPMKKHHTETVVVGQTRFRVPHETAKAVLVLLKGSLHEDNEIIFADDSKSIRKMDAKFSRPGACLQGARLKNGLTQVDLAQQLGIPQGNLSAMESGRRPIGRNMALRLAKALDVDHRIFLG